MAPRDELIPKATKLPIHMWIAAGALALTGWFLWAGRSGPQVGPLPTLALLDEGSRPIEKAWFREGPTVLFLFLPGDARDDAQAAAFGALQAAWAPQGVRFLGVSLAAAPVEAGRYGFRVARAKGNVLEQLSVRSLPSTVLVNRHAQVVARVEGIHGPEELSDALAKETLPR